MDWVDEMRIDELKNIEQFEQIIKLECIWCTKWMLRIMRMEEETVWLRLKKEVQF